MFDIIFVNLDAGFYLCMTPEKALAKAGARIKVGNSNVTHCGGPMLPEDVGAYICPRLCRYFYLFWTPW